ARSPSPPIAQIEYEGTLLFEAHFRHPGDVHPYHSRQRFLSDGGDRARLDWTTWENGDTLLVPETYLLAGGRVLHRDAPNQPWRLLAGSRARQGRLLAQAGLPGPLERAIRAEHDPLAELSVVRGHLVRFTRLQAHPRLGDVRDSVAFTYRGADLAP